MSFGNLRRSWSTTACISLVGGQSSLFAFAVMSPRKLHLLTTLSRNTMFSKKAFLQDFGFYPSSFPDAWVSVLFATSWWSLRLSLAWLDVGSISHVIRITLFHNKRHILWLDVMVDYGCIRASRLSRCLPNEKNKFESFSLFLPLQQHFLCSASVL